jgi:uncharacterized protein
MKRLCVVRAHTFSQRLFGLMRKKSFEGYLLFERCRMIHTCWMRFPIDVIALDKKGQVLGSFSHLKPWRIYCAPRGTVSIIECSSLYEKKIVFSSGDKLELEYI